MPHRDPEFGPEGGGDGLTIPCYLAKGYDEPGFLQWRQDHPDWFVAGTWTSQPSANEVRRPSPAPTRASVGQGRAIPPLDPSTISLADFRAVAGQAKQQRAVRTDAIPLKPSLGPPTHDAPS